jgi:hypothetical protein
MSFFAVCRARLAPWVAAVSCASRNLSRLARSVNPIGSAGWRQIRIRVRLTPTFRVSAGPFLSEKAFWTINSPRRHDIPLKRLLPDSIAPLCGTQPAFFRLPPNIPTDSPLESVFSRDARFDTDRKRCAHSSAILGLRQCDHGCRDFGVVSSGTGKQPGRSATAAHH